MASVPPLPAWLPVGGFVDWEYKRKHAENCQQGKPLVQSVQIHGFVAALIAIQPVGMTGQASEK